MSNMNWSVRTGTRGKLGPWAIVTALVLAAALAVVWWAAPVQAAADSTGFRPEKVSLGSVGSSVTITLETVNVDATADGFQANLQHSSDLGVSAPACTGIFQGATLLPTQVVTGGTLIGCFFLSADVSGATGDLMTFELTRLEPCVPGSEEQVTLGVGGAEGTQFSDGGTGIDPGATGTLTVVCGVTVSGDTDLQFRSSTSGLVTIQLSGTGFDESVTAEDDGAWEITGVSDGTYTLTAAAPGYLTAENTGLSVGDVDLAVPANVLKTGDINGDGFVNINDVTGVTSNFGQGSPQAWP